MKKLTVFLFMLMSLACMSQTFEGTVKFSMKAEITDPKMKAQMEQGMQQLNDPATQAKMKEMQEKMNDPQMKAMMEANPQMKAQIENAMKMAQGGAAPGGGMSSMMPTGFTYKMKDGNSLTILEGGMMPMEVLTLKDKLYRIDRKNKTYSELGAGGPPNVTQPAKPQVQITKTNEQATILKYKCTKYIATITEKDKTINQIYWTTTEIKDFDLKSLAKQRMGRGEPMFYEGIEGVPLKIEMTMPEAKMIMEVTEIKRETLNASDFSLPADFKQIKGMF
jgi:hypothetical protein